MLRLLAPAASLDVSGFTALAVEYRLLPGGQTPEGTTLFLPNNGEWRPALPAARQPPARQLLLPRGWAQEPGRRPPPSLRAASLRNPGPHPPHAHHPPTHPPTHRAGVFFYLANELRLDTSSVASAVAGLRSFIPDVQERLLSILLFHVSPVGTLTQHDLADNADGIPTLLEDK